MFIVISRFIASRPRWSSEVDIRGMLVPKGLSKGKFMVMAIVLALALAVVGYLVLVNLFGGEVPQVGSKPPLDFSVTLPKPPLFNRNFFMQPTVRDLQNYGALPLQAPASLPGNPNLFGTSSASSSSASAGR